MAFLSKAYLVGYQLFKASRSMENPFLNLGIMSQKQQAGMAKECSLFSD